MGNLLLVCGSLRAGSFNAKLLEEGARIWPGTHSRANLRFPLFDADLEAEGMPEAVTRIVEQIAQSSAVLIATPEYNKSLSGVLKNALDWVSRDKSKPWRDKPVAIVSATAGRTGGERAQSALRLAMNPFRPRLLTGPEVLVAAARDQFDEAGRLTNERYLKVLTELVEDLHAAADAS